MFTDVVKLLGCVRETKSLYTIASNGSQCIDKRGAGNTKKEEYIICFAKHDSLRWKVHVKEKRKELGLKYKKVCWLMERRSALSVHNKLTLYKQILKPVWTYGIQLWGCTKQSNIGIIQRFKSKVRT
jgi:hypothetical protein